MRRDGHIVASNWHVNMAPTNIVRDHTASDPDKAAVLYFTLLIVLRRRSDESLPEILA